MRIAPVSAGAKENNMNVMKTKEFLKQAGMVVALLALFGVFAGVFATPAWSGERVFTFVASSEAAPLTDGTLPRVTMQGSGSFDAEDGEVEGRGSFVVLNQNASVPKPILLSGLWKATKFVSYTNTNASGVPFGSYDHIQAGILVLLINLHLDDGRVVTGATLTIVCNIGAAGASTGQVEGYKLTVPGTAFGEFSPLSPIVGISHLSTVRKEQKED